ncbi:MBL fold metallo-hydrolase [Aurantiacibacter aquimixticola]|uniref:MBL fold metallo-hydrolase n=1 Tax=Aurantiacibacter aquimixticola TaxID=1958945 RepID=A0A419RRT7_9SPHN|nr:MBL fold metallo-hydrolase [Aurantiacibacter aquimixticola]RJY08479.1 MBL fold metallo-hydrolase [Aurantiacibacter aquimixticola]
MHRLLVVASIAALSTAAPANAQDMADVEIRAEQVAPGVAVLFGRGGNIGVSHGEDGTILIDDQYAPLTERIQAAIADLGASPARFVVNTHWHGDHTGGNENLAEDGATIVAHDNVRIRLAEGGEIRGNAIAPRPDALPVITYDTGMTFHVNGDTVDVIYLGGGHTDGDSVVFWREANVLHMGDLFFHEFGWPFIDVDSGGNALQLLTSLDLAIAMIDEETAVIPGHGPMATRADLVAYRTMLSMGIDRVRALHDEGRSLEEAIAAKPVEGINLHPNLFSQDDDFVTAVFGSLDGHGHTH